MIQKLNHLSIKQKIHFSSENQEWNAELSLLDRKYPVLGLLSKVFIVKKTLLLINLMEKIKVQVYFFHEQVILFFYTEALEALELFQILTLSSASKLTAPH